MRDHDRQGFMNCGNSCYLVSALKMSYSEWQKRPFTLLRLQRFWLRQPLPGKSPGNSPGDPGIRDTPLVISRGIPGKRISREPSTHTPTHPHREIQWAGAHFPPGCPAGLSRGMHICRPVEFHRKRIFRAIARRQDFSHRTGERRVSGALFR